jgi:hypothetical protein
MNRRGFIFLLLGNIFLFNKVLYSKDFDEISHYNGWILTKDYFRK